MCSHLIEPWNRDEPEVLKTKHLARVLTRTCFFQSSIPRSLCTYVISCHVEKDGKNNSNQDIQDRIFRTIVISGWQFRWGISVM